jgi:hypothetical protein
MIRRGFWLAAGAAGGIIGYRRAASLGRNLSATLMLSRGTQAEPQAEQAVPSAARPVRRPRKPGPGLARQAIRLSRDARRFSRDVREGMDLYMARRPGRVSPTLGAVATRGDDSPERLEGAPDGRQRHRIGRAEPTTMNVQRMTTDAVG